MELNWFPDLEAALCAGGSGAELSLSEKLSGNVRSRRAPSEANGPQGQQGHAKIHSGYIWTCGCPPARLSLKSSCLFRNNAEEAATSLLFQCRKICLFKWLFALPVSDHCWVAVPKLQKHQHSSVQTVHLFKPDSSIYQPCTKSNSGSLHLSLV